MIIDTTVHTQEVKRKITSKIGESYSLIERIRKGGIGSKRMRIGATSPQFQPFLSNTQDTTYCSIEKRKLGIAIHFKKYQTVYSWLISADNLNYSNGETFTFTAEDHALSIQKDRYFTENKSFLEGLFDEMIE